MIQARFSYDKRHRKLRLELRGHAGTAPWGEDLVCAGVSALALTAGKTAEHLNNRGLLDRPPRIRLEEGNALILATAKRGFEAEVLLSFWTVQVGIHALAQLYPECVSLERVLRV